MRVRTGRFTSREHTTRSGIAMRFHPQISHGYHAGEMGGIAPTNREVTFPYIVIFRIAGGKITEVWENFDTYDFLKQLGTVPPLGEGGEKICSPSRTLF